MYLTTQNAHQYIGKILDEKRRYSITIHYLSINGTTGIIFRRDRNMDWRPGRNRSFQNCLV